MAPKAADARGRLHRTGRSRGHGQLLQKRGPIPQRVACPRCVTEGAPSPPPHTTPPHRQRREPAHDQLVMTHKRIAQVLRVRREGVTAGALRLHEAGRIRYRRGHISVLDRAGIERRSCHRSLDKRIRRNDPGHPVPGRAREDRTGELGGPLEIADREKRLSEQRWRPDLIVERRGCRKRHHRLNRLPERKQAFAHQFESLEVRVDGSARGEGLNRFLERPRVHVCPT